MDILTILLFFIYTWGFGYTISRFFKNSENFLERNLMRIGFGLGCIPLIGIILSILRVPLQWWLFLILSGVFPIFDLFKMRMPKFRFTKSDLYTTAVLVIFLISLYVYVSGAFKYPWPEDDDSWNHAPGIKYVAIEKTVNTTSDNFMYINPYPPGYDLMLGVLHQTSKSLYWTMKFFNSLIVSLSIIFFYFFAKRFIGNKNKALFATFILSSIPCYLSHFIWSHSLAMALLFPALYAVEMLKEDKKWSFLSIITISSICLAQPTKPIKFAFLFVSYFVIKCISEKKFNFSLLFALFGGYLLSLIWWLNHWKAMFISGAGGAVSTPSGGYAISSFILLLKRAFPPNSGSATRPYSFNEIFFAQHQNMINNPIGIGLFISILILISLVFILINYKRLLSAENNYLLITFLWALTTFLAFNSMTFNLPFGLFSFRWWMIFALPASILATEGAWFIIDLFKKLGKNHFQLLYTLVLIILSLFFIFSEYYIKFTEFLLELTSVPSVTSISSFILLILNILFKFFFNKYTLISIIILLVILAIKFKSSFYIKIFIFLILIIGVFATSAYQKYSVNTAIWPFGIG